jgi:beta-lactamase class A
LFPSLGVAILLVAAACSDSTSQSAQTSTRPTGKTTSTSPAFVATVAPSTPAGAQLTWVIGAVTAAPLSQQVIDTHFDSSFLTLVHADKINSAFLEIHSSSAGTLVGVLSEEPTSLKAVASFGGGKVTLTVSVDAGGLIDGLLLRPYVPPVPTSWAQLDQRLAALAPNTSFLAARISSSGACIPTNQVASTTPRPLGSMFKLFVLGALAHQIAAGKVRWNQELTVTDSLRSLGSVSGSLQYSPAGTQVTVEQAATKMISISDNTAADILISLVGRSAVESQVRRWSSGATLDDPFLTTRELFLLHYKDYPSLANQYLRLDPSQRAAFLSSSVDPLSLSQLRGSTDPRDIESLEWFASPDDLCRALAGLKQLSEKTALEPIASILSINHGDIGLDTTQWPTVWFKGGSEPGVLTVGYLARNSDGHTFVVVGMLANPTAALSPSATGELIALARGAYGIVK